MENKRGVIFGDTILEGIYFIKKDGSKEFVKCKNLIVLSTAEANNKK